MSVDNLKDKESNRVVVTDASVITGLGNNLESLWQGLMSGETAIRPITRFPVDQDHYKAKIAAHIDDLKSSGGRSLLLDLLDRQFFGTCRFGVSKLGQYLINFWLAQPPLHRANHNAAQEFSAMKEQ